MARLRTHGEGPVDLRSEKQVSFANRPGGRPKFEEGIAGAEAAKLKKFSAGAPKGASPLGWGAGELKFSG